MSSQRLPADEEDKLVLAILGGQSLRSREVSDRARHELEALYPDKWVYLVAAEVLGRLVNSGKVEKFKDPRWIREHCYRVSSGIKPAEAPAYAIPPKGCICPPGSNLTCQRWDCGRKTISGLNGPAFSIVASGMAAFDAGLNSKKD